MNICMIGAGAIGVGGLLGEPDGNRSERGERVAAALQTAGLEAPLSQRIRDDIWTKLIGNLAFNPICALSTIYVWIKR